jgi:DNA-binding NtrC family response regulator
MMTKEKIWVLIIEDEITSRGILAGLLKKKGFNIVCADEGQHATEILKYCTPDCILLDLIMPKMHGQAFLSKFRETDKDTPVIIMSAIDNQPALVATMESLGIQAWMPKPVDAEVVSQKIKEFVEAKRKNSEAKAG